MDSDDSGMSVHWNSIILKLVSFSSTSKSSDRDVRLHYNNIPNMEANLLKFQTILCASAWSNDVDIADDDDDEPEMTAAMLVMMSA